MLDNEKYVGDVMMQKRVTLDPLTHREVKNDQTVYPTVAYEPMFFWKQIKHGASFILAHVLTGWRALTQRMVTGV